MSRKSLALVLSLSLPMVAHASSGAREAARNDGVEGLCSAVEQLAEPHLGGARTVALQLSTEGGALDLADSVRGACELVLAAEARAIAPVASAERVVRLRVRIAAPNLTALVDVLAPVPGENRQATLASRAIEVPLGSALASWLNAAGAGLETWLAGTLESEVLALCGADIEGDGVPEVAFVTPDAIEFARWTVGAFVPIARSPLPASVRSHARAPGFTAHCRAEPGRLVTILGVHDRDVTATVALAGELVTWLPDVGGIYLGPTGGEGGSLFAAGVRGTGLVRWKDAVWSSIATMSSRKTPQNEVVAVTQDGQLAVAAGPDRPLTFAGAGLPRVGADLVILDLDGDGKFEVATSRALLPGTESGDRLVVLTLGARPEIRHESPPLRGLIDAVGAVSSGSWWRVLAAEHGGGRTHLYALGRRLDPSPRAE